MAWSSRTKPYAGSPGLAGARGLRRNELRQSTVMRTIPARASTARSSHIFGLAEGDALGSKMLLSVNPVISPRVLALAVEAPAAAVVRAAHSAIATTHTRGRTRVPRVRAMIPKPPNTSVTPAFQLPLPSSTRRLTSAVNAPTEARAGRRGPPRRGYPD